MPSLFREVHKVALNIISIVKFNLHVFYSVYKVYSIKKNPILSS